MEHGNSNGNSFDKMVPLGPKVYNNLCSACEVIVVKNTRENIWLSNHKHIACTSQSFILRTLLKSHAA